jgi:hypothetical protein
MKPPAGTVTASLASRTSVSSEGESKTLRVFEVLSKDQDRSSKVTSRITRPVVFDFGRRRYYVSTSLQSEVEDLLASPVQSVQIEEINASQLTKEIQNLSAQEPDESFRLNRWPDLKKLGQNPLHLKLTALLRRGGTVDYIADFIKAPPDEIIAFINACYLLNYLVHEKKAAVAQNKPLEPQGMSAGKRGLLSRIRSRLGI